MTRQHLATFPRGSSPETGSSQCPSAGRPHLFPLAPGRWRNQAALAAGVQSLAQRGVQGFPEALGFPARSAGVPAVPGPRWKGLRVQPPPFLRSEAVQTESRHRVMLPVFKRAKGTGEQLSAVRFA